MNKIKKKQQRNAEFVASTFAERRSEENMRKQDMTVIKGGKKVCI